VERFVDEPTALISGAPAWLLSRVLRSPSVVKVLTSPPAGLNETDVAAAVAAIHKAGRAWEKRSDQQQRDNAVPAGAVVGHYWTTKRAAEHLEKSQRRVQELAAALGGTRVGREWRIPEVAVREYQRAKAGNAA
jgi:hypothetical protein